MLGTTLKRTPKRKTHYKPNETTASPQKRRHHHARHKVCLLRIKCLVLAPVVTARCTLLLLGQGCLVLSQLLLRGTVLLEDLGAVD